MHGILRRLSSHALGLLVGLIEEARVLKLPLHEPQEIVSHVEDPAGAPVEEADVPRRSKELSEPCELHLWPFGDGERLKGREIPVAGRVYER